MVLEKTTQGSSSCLSLGRTLQALGISQGGGSSQTTSLLSRQAGDEEVEEPCGIHIYRYVSVRRKFIAPYRRCSSASKSRCRSTNGHVQRRRVILPPRAPPQVAGIGAVAQGLACCQFAGGFDVDVIFL